MTTTTLDPRHDVAPPELDDVPLAHIVELDENDQPDPVALCGYRIRGVPAAWDAPCCIVCFDLAGLGS